MILVWVLIGSFVCTLIYSIVMFDYMRHDAMWEECLFPGVVIWNKLKETNINIMIGVILTGIAWLALFIYPLIVTLLCVLVLLPIAIWEFIKHIFS